MQFSSSHFGKGIPKSKSAFNKEMAISSLAFTFGILGNFVSFMVFLAPVPTFYSIYKKKTSEGFQSIPYVVALFSASLFVYYAALKTNAILISSINSFGCVIEMIYLLLFLIYAPKKSKVATMKMVFLFNIGCLGLIIAFSLTLVKGAKRVTMVGWLCAVTNIAVFAAPLSIMGQVIRTKSVEFMPITLSFFLTLSAKTWFFYGFFVKDYYIAFPNILGFILGIIQMILYMIYKDAKKNVDRMNIKLDGARDPMDKVFQMKDLENGNGGA